VHSKWNASRGKKIWGRTLEQRGADRRTLSLVYGAAFLLRAARARGRNLRSPRTTYNINRFTFSPIKYAAWRFNYLTVAAAAEFAWFGAAVRMNNQLVDMPEDSLDEFTSGRGIIERNVISDGV
jgi:hypothetical protein